MFELEEESPVKQVTISRAEFRTDASGRARDIDRERRAPGPFERSPRRKAQIAGRPAGLALISVSGPGRAGPHQAARLHSLAEAGVASMRQACKLAAKSGAGG